MERVIESMARSVVYHPKRVRASAVRPLNVAMTVHGLNRTVILSYIGDNQIMKGMHQTLHDSR